MAGYPNDTYLRSLEASSADVDRQVANALTEIGRQRQTAVAQTAQIPGATSNIFNEGSQRLSADTASLGVKPLGSLMSAFENSKESYGRVRGLLDQGFGEQETRRRGSVQSVKQDLLAGIRERSADYTARREAEDRSRAFAAEQAAASRALQEEMMRRQEAIQTSALAAEQEEARKQRLWESLAALQEAGIGADYSWGGYYPALDPQARSRYFTNLGAR